MKSDKLLVGLLVGLSAGALLGIIIGAKKGLFTRKKNTKKKADYTDAVNEKFNDLIDSITERFKQLRAETDEFIEQEKNKIRDVKKDIETAKS